MHSMILGVNLLPLRLEGGGTRHFAESLLLEFTTPPFSSRHLLFLMCFPEMREHCERLFKGAPNVAIVTVKSAVEVVACQELFDLYFCPLNSLSPLLPARPSVACLMDIQEKFFPAFFSEKQLDDRRILYGDVVHRATIACTISEFCGRTFVEQMNANPERIRVVRLYPQKRLMEAKPALPLNCPSKFILYPANWYAHKNHRNLIEGYVEAKRRCAGLPDLVLVGHPMGNEDWLASLAASDIHVYTEISPENLRALYERSEFVVLPTLFEGYCMPLAEAIILRRPVLANDLPVMREIGGDWPFYAPLEVAGQITSALLTMHEQEAVTDSRVLPPAIAGWGWREIALEYETIFNQALVKHRIENPRL
jgi:glycosyltransferase involved in cell wall biosynthesis